MIRKIIICAAFFSYATCRTAKDFREMPEATARLSQAQYPSYNIREPDGPGTYAFGYEIEDLSTGNVQFRDEEKLRNGTVRGSYGLLLPDNTLHITRYVADQFGYHASSETRKKQDNGPLKLELQVQPSVLQKPYPIRVQSQSAAPVGSSSTTPFPDPFETVKPQLDPALASAIYQQQQINLQPTYSPFRDRDILDPETANAILYQQQYFQPQNPVAYGYRQNVDGSVSTYTVPSSQTSSQNRPPFFNWFGTNNNNNNANYQNDQQQGPVLGFLTNLAQNNPITTFFNGFQTNNDQVQNQNPFQNFLTNINPLNLFSNNNNRPQQSPTLQSLQNPAIQSDYVPSMSPSNSLLSNNLDSSVFSNDHLYNPNQFYQNGNINPYAGSSLSNSIQSSNFNPGFNGLSNSHQSANFNPGFGNPTPIYNPNYNQQGIHVGVLSTTNRPGFIQGGLSSSNALPYSQNYNQRPSYPIYQNPYQTISPINIMQNPNYNQKKKTSNKKSKRKNNKNKVDVPDSESDWFNDFLDKRKEISLDVSSRRPTKKVESEEDDDSDFDDYFR